MKVIAIERETGKGRYTKEILEKEAKRIYILYKEGKVRELYFTKKEHPAIIILEVRNIPEAQKIINTLPLVRTNLIEFELKELIPYNGYDRILKA